MPKTKAFVSYTHADDKALNRFHVFLVMLQREGLLSTWTDHSILPGAKFSDEISANLAESAIFIALVSPDYLASNYCYEKEFKSALSLNEAGKLRIVPVIIEPCDWLHSPFQQFLALPKDGKPISTWENENSAYLDMVNGLRRILDNPVFIPASTDDVELDDRDHEISLMQWMYQDGRPQEEKLFVNVPELETKLKLPTGTFYRLIDNILAPMSMRVLGHGNVMAVIIADKNARLLQKIEQVSKIEGGKDSHWFGYLKMIYDAVEWRPKVVELDLDALGEQLLTGPESALHVTGALVEIMDYSVSYDENEPNIMRLVRN